MDSREKAFLCFILCALSLQCLIAAVAWSRALPFETGVGVPRKLAVQEFEEPMTAEGGQYEVGNAIFRTFVICYLAPFVLFYNQDLAEASTVIQAYNAAGIFSWWDTFAAIKYVGDMPPVIEGLYNVLFPGALTAYTMMASETWQLLIKGGLFAHGVLQQLLPILDVYLMTWAGCTDRDPVLAVQRGQRYDAWLGCTEETNYYVAIWMTKIVEWSLVAFGAYIARRIAKVMKRLSAAMVGANMCGSAVQRMVEDCLYLATSQENVNKARELLVLCKAGIVFGLTAYGFFAQSALAGWFALPDDERRGKRKEVRCCFRWLTYLWACGTPLYTFDNFLVAKTQASLRKGADRLAEKLEGRKSWFAESNNPVKVAPADALRETADGANEQ